MAEAAEIISLCAGTAGGVDIVFVHGLTGHALETWTSPSGECWPQWLCEKFPAARIFAIGYPASIFGKWAKKEMDIHERAINMLEYMTSMGIGERPIIFVTHSLGGILIKEILRTSAECTDDDWKKISENTKLVAFIGTPHSGASLAAAIKIIVPRISSSHLELLTNESGYLSSLNQFYRDFSAISSIATVSYYEKYKTKDAILVVPRESADPGVGSTRPIPIDADHISICKPDNRDSMIFVSLCRHVGKVMKALPQLAPVVSTGDDFFTADDYSIPSETDRRDLLQKLIDAGREHEYQKANDLQNKFAQKYYKLGLSAESKEKSDAILSSVEQRFLTHVYYPKICKGASDEEIASALQNHVIDALCANGVAGQSLTHKAILQALYFLTEQCHIQWDVAA